MKLLVCAILLSFTGGIAGLKCYTCTAGYGWDTDTNACRDPFNPDDGRVSKTNCESLGAGEYACAKVRFNVDAIMSRSCLLVSMCNEGSNGCLDNSDATGCCCNTGDYCNAAGRVTVSVFSAIGVFTALLFVL